MQTVLEPRPLDPAVVAWKLKEPLQSLCNILYPAMGSKKRVDESEENKLQSNCRQHVDRIDDLNAMRTTLVR